MNKLKIKKESLISIIVSTIIIFSFFIGFFIGENSAGGGGYNGDIQYIWNNQNTFNNFSIIDSLNFTSVYDPVHFQSSKMPLSYIINKLFNPLTFNLEGLRVSVFILSLISYIAFTLTIKTKYPNVSLFVLIMLSSVLLLSPYFRTSGFWGLEENYSVLCSVISGFFYLKFQKTKLNTYLFFLIFFSSLCIYFDQKLVIVPLICFFNIIFSKISKEKKIFTIIFYSLLSLPCFYLFFLWKSVMPVSDSIHRNFGEINLLNIGISSTIIAFYLFPLIFLKKNEFNNIFQIFKNKLNLLSITLIFVYLIFLLNYNFELPKLGGGAIIKFILIFFKNPMYQKISFIFICFFSYLIILFFIEKNFQNFLIIHFFIFLSLIINPIYQEYFDPLIIILAFLFLKMNFVINFKRSIIILPYYAFLLVISNFYYS